MRLLAQNPILSGFEGSNVGLNGRRYHPFQVVKMASYKPSSLLHPKKGLLGVTGRQIPDKYLGHSIENKILTSFFHLGAK
jgi:hypothetical protein